MSTGHAKFDFGGQLVLVTGSTQGIGKSIAESFLKAGASVILNGRKKDAVDKAVADLSKLVSAEKKGKVYGVTADISDAKSAAELCSQVDKIGNLDILVNNVGIFYSKDVFQVTEEEWMTIFNVNVFSVVRMITHFLPKMLKANKGRVVNIGSEAGLRPIPHMIHYSATKSTLLGLTRGFAELTKGTKVTVNDMCAGPTMTEGVQDYLIGLWKKDHPDLAQDAKNIPNMEKLQVDYFKIYEPTSLLQRFITVQELADTVLFVSSETGGSITGCNLRCEGGIVRSI
jgi:NAD(P)-dependent dehydrogenase (short-subunit alcohol dehydrogenase family)